METQSVAQYVVKNYPEILEEFRRLTTPFYYEPDIVYNPITSGFGCGPGGSKERFIIKNGTYLKNGDISLHLQSLDKEGHNCGTYLSEAHKKIAREDESVAPIGKLIPNDRTVKYMTIDGRDYTITQLMWRNYKDQTLCGRIFVNCNQFPTSRVYGREQQSYYELYCHFGSKWNMKHVTSYDSTGRENYDIKFNISIREFKRIVFGNANIKIKCQLFGDK